MLGWDTEGGDRAKLNLLRSPIVLRFRTGGRWRSSADLRTRFVGKGLSRMRYELSVAPGSVLAWTVDTSAGGMTMSFSGAGPEMGRLRAIELLFPWDTRLAATTVLAADWTDEGKLRLPAIISAPDLGQMYVASPDRPKLEGRLEGSRDEQWVDFVLELPAPADGMAYAINFSPVVLPPPNGLEDTSMWPAARRGWFNVYQPNAAWRPAPGYLANNVLSDVVSSLVSLFADHMLHLPELAPGVSAARMVRRTVEHWVDYRNDDGSVAYVDGSGVNRKYLMDTNSAVLTAAWGYIEATGDEAWLAGYVGRLESVAEYIERRDTDGDGLVESRQTGNTGTRVFPDSAIDAISSGHKNAYCNALAYRALLCLADLEARLRRTERQAHYARLARRLKRAYFPTFYDTKAGWLTWWISADGQRHTYASPTINGLAIEYGLVPADEGRRILDRFWRKIEKVGFSRFDLGVPINLVPVLRDDQRLGHGGESEDGSDGFQRFCNGACIVLDTLHFLAAHYVLGQRKRADSILRAMLRPQQTGVFANGGAFQNGIVNQHPEGAEFFDWQGKPAGYEGYLSYSWSFLDAVVLREPRFRRRLYRPLRARTVKY